MAEQIRKKQKFAIIGTSSAGKTTLSLRILADLKRLGVLADGVLQQDRRLAFDREQLETDIEAQYWVIFNMVTKESEMMLKKGTDVIISDRSVLDFYAYMEHMYGRVEHVWEFVLGWCKTYDALYCLDPLAYHDDGNRPSNEFRLNVATKLNSLIDEIIADHPGINVKRLNRDCVYGDVLTLLNRKLTEEELSFIPDVLGFECLVGGSYAFNRATRFSDVDIYVLDEAFADLPALSKQLRGVFGSNMEVRSVNKAVWDYYLEGGFKLLSPRRDKNSLNFTKGGDTHSLPLVSAFPLK